ncbi:MULTISPECIES: protein kinase [unclassified Streptomyces]|uniref:protein kinase domain-containing protein n=1 Tax=unclassified Streptomyces TaxID=2593676 RepID=UPI001BAF3EDB|nr:protein kinase [Streptomyces sp. A2-16]QUC56144.1 protein kinase [Streptomyces sp. A2-16]
MDDYAGRVLADRYRLPLPPSDEYELTETRAFDTYSGQEVLVRQVPLPEVVEAEVLDAGGLPEGFTARDPRSARRPSGRGGARRPTEPAVRRAVEAAQAAARIPDHPRLDQVFDVFAEGGSLWIVSELVSARSLAALLSEKPLTPYRAAEVASDVLMALRVLHAHGWVHRNITARTVLVCDDGRVMLTGLAVGAAEEALCGYDPVPIEAGEWGTGGGEPGAGAVDARGGGPGRADGRGGPVGPAGLGGSAGPGGHRVPGQSTGPGGGLGGVGRAGGAGVSGGAGGARTALGGGAADAAFGLGARNAGPGPGGALTFGAGDPEAARRAAIEAREARGLPGAGVEAANGTGASAELVRREPDGGTDVRAARAGAIAAYRAGARAAARVQESQNSRAALPGARPAPEADPTSRTQDTHPAVQADGVEQPRYPSGNGGPQSPYPSDDPGSQSPYALGNGAEQRPYPSADGVGQSPYPSGNSGSQSPYPSANGGSQSPYPLGGGAQSSGPSVNGLAQPPYPVVDGVEQVPGVVAPGRIADPYGVRPAPWHGAVPRGGGEASAGEVPAPDAVPAVEQASAPTRWEDLPPADAPARRGPTTALAAERARQARMAVVGPVTERWAPEQAGPVHENWQLAAPIGPATDLWALGALLFRAVQGHAPYPEESTAELVQLVCAEPPAFAEECGPLRPVVESLLRQDPTERLDFEELRGWLRSLVRSAPEPEAGAHVVAAPPVDASRLPIVRRRGELVRRRRAGLPATHGRHKRARDEAAPSPRRLGRNLLLLILLVMAAAIAYAMYFMPKSNPDDGAARKTGSTSQAGPAQSPEAGSDPRPEPTTPEPSQSSGAAETQTAGPEVADGFTLRTDAEGFKIAVANGWDRTPRNGRGQVVYSKGGFELIVVPGRDTATANGGDPMVYQREKEPELQPYRDSSWATATGLKSIQVGTRSMAEGQFTWTADDGRELYVRNLAILIGGKYHVVQVRGPEAERDEVTRLYEQASATYQVTG